VREHPRAEREEGREHVQELLVLARGQVRVDEGPEELDERLVDRGPMRAGAAVRRTRSPSDPPLPSLGP
jgi:hypothetical protein